MSLLSSLKIITTMVSVLRKSRGERMYTTVGRLGRSRSNGHMTGYCARWRCREVWERGEPCDFACRLWDVHQLCLFRVSRAPDVAREEVSSG